MDSKELAILVIQSRNNLLDFVVRFWLVEEVSIVDDEDKGEEAQNDIHMRIATDNEDKVDQFNYSYH